MSSKKLEDAGNKSPSPTVELLLPINTYWEVEAMLKKMDYMTAAGEDPVLIGDAYQKVLRKVAKYAVFEKDRTMLQERINGSSSSGS